jgi:hypothetical protein
MNAVGPLQQRPHQLACPSLIARFISFSPEEPGHTRPWADYLN